MKEQVIAKSYAKAIIELGDSQGVDVGRELMDFTRVINECNNLENVLFSEVFTIEEKIDVTEKILDKLKISPVLRHFIIFLLGEKRIHLFPSIFKEVVVLDDYNKGFMRGAIEGPDRQISENLKAEFIRYLGERVGKKVQLTYRKNENVTAGYRVSVEDLQLDASVDNQLDRFKESVLH